MNKGVLAAIMFAGGACIGAAAGWIFAVKKYQKLVDAVMKSKTEQTSEEKPVEVPEQEQPAEATKVEEVKIEAVQENPMSLENNFQKQAARIALEKPEPVNYNKINYKQLIMDNKYMPQTTNEDDEEFSEYPYLITPDKIPFGEKVDSNGNPYEKITLIYYEDGYLADTTYEIIDDVDRIVGNENLTHFGDFPNKDSIFVRNDILKEDIEVCVSMLTWEGDILERMPYLRES